MRASHRLLVVVSIVSLAVAGAAAGGVFAQETETPTENNTTAAQNETETEVANDTAVLNETETEAENATGAVNETETATPAAQVSFDEVIFDDQTSNGSSVEINKTRLIDGGYVVIFTVNESEMDNATADGLNETETEVEENVTADENETENVTVDTNATEEDGLNETETEENATADEGLNETETEENATAEENVTAGENETEAGAAGSNATDLDQVTNETLGEVVGNSTLLGSGTTQNVTVPLHTNESLDDQVLVAVAYEDEFPYGQFDGPENESIYVAADRPVADWAYVTFEEDNATTENETVGNETGLNETETETELGTNETETNGGLNETETETEGGLNETEAENETEAMTETNATETETESA